MTPAAGFGQDACLLHLAIKLTQRGFKGGFGIDNNLAHRHYQRDLLEPERWRSRGW